MPTVEAIIVPTVGAVRGREKGAVVYQAYRIARFAATDRSYGGPISHNCCWGSSHETVAAILNIQPLPGINKVPYSGHLVIGTNTAFYNFIDDVADFITRVRLYQ